MAGYKCHLLLLIMLLSNLVKVLFLVQLQRWSSYKDILGFLLLDFRNETGKCKENVSMYVYHFPFTMRTEFTNVGIATFNVGK